MQPLLTKIRPTNGFGHIFHLALVISLPIVLFILVRLPLLIPAFVIIFLSKWRVISVRPRFWPATFRANAIDLIVGLSILAFMIHADSALLQALWALVYMGWLLFIKPANSTLMVSIQAGVGLFVGLTALFVVAGAGQLYVLVIGSGLLCYLAARHFFDGYEEPHSKMLSYLWGYFGAALVWLLGHWLLFYSVIAQPTLLLCIIGYGLAALYYFDHTEKLSSSAKRQLILILSAIIVGILVFSDWGGKIV